MRNRMITCGLGSLQVLPAPANNGHRARRVFRRRVEIRGGHSHGIHFWRAEEEDGRSLEACMLDAVLRQPAPDAYVGSMIDAYTQDGRMLRRVLMPSPAGGYCLVRQTEVCYEKI